jgi:TP901 family phage tail tape measure protein
MPTVADLLTVNVQVNVGNSAASVNTLSKELSGIGTTSQAASTATSGVSNAFSLQNQNALRLAGALIGVNVGLSAVSAVGRELHAAIADLIGTNVRFGATMATVSAVSGATSTQLAELGDLARTSGLDIGIGANEGARGLAELIKGGVSTEAALGGALRATELMAKAGGVDLAQAAEISAVALNSFGLSAAQLPHVADLVAAAANASSIDVNDFRQSLSQAGAVARTVGVSFDDTSVAIAELGQAGLKGSDAGTSLRTFLLRLTPESKEAEAAMRSLGIITTDGSNRFFDASGKAKGLSDISQVLKTSLAGYTDQQKIATLQTIFGTDAVRAASILAREGAAGFDTLAASMAKIGADEVANKRLDSLSGDMDKLAVQAERLKLVLGEGIIGGRPGVQAATRFISDLATANEPAPPGEVNLANRRLLESQGINTSAGGPGGVDVFVRSVTPEARRFLEGQGIPLAADAQVGVVSDQAAAAQIASNKAAAQAAAEQAATSIQADNAISGAFKSQAQRATEQLNAMLKPARDLRAELDALGKTGVDAAQGLGVLEAATAGLRLATAGDIEAVARMRAEGALRQREKAAGVINRSEEFRQKLVVETTDSGISQEDRAKAAERLAFFDKEVEAQRRLAQIEQQRAAADLAVKTEQDLQRQASLGLEISQLPLQDKALETKIASLELDQQAAPLRSQLLTIEEQINRVTDQRLGLQRELAILQERQRSASERNALGDNQTRIRELQLELQTRDPSLDRGAIRREIRGLQRAQPGLELDVLRSDRTITNIQRQQEATKLSDDIRINGLNQQKVALQDQLTPLEQRKRLIDEAAQSISRQLEIEKGQFDQSQSGSRARLLRAQQIAGALGLSEDEQKAVIATLGLPQQVQGPQPIAGQPGGGGPISVTIQNLGDNYVRSDADIASIQQAQQQAVIDAIANVMDKAASDATPAPNVNLSGAQRPQGQPQ